MNLTYPLRFHFRRLPGRPALGADGLVRAIHRLQPNIALDRIRVLSGLAFRTYQLTPADNHAYATQHGDLQWRWETLAMENYGILESLTVHLNRELRLYPSMRPIDALALARYEFDLGRSIFGRVRGRGGEYALLTSVETEKERYDGPDAGDSDFVVESTDAKRFPAGEHIADSMLVARPQREPIPESRSGVLERDVMKFAGLHARSKRELNFGEELFYASGLRALDVTADLIVDAEDSPEWREYFDAWCSDLRDARTSAARQFGGDVGTAYQNVADAVPTLHADFDWSDRLAREHVAGAMRELEAMEELALEALSGGSEED